MERLFSLRAQTGLCCLVFSADGFQKVLKQFPEAAAEVLREIASQVFEWEYGLLHGDGKLCAKCTSAVGVTLL